MLDYNFPPFSVGEVRPIRGPGRREIGHGALAERSVKPVLPDPEEFPYTIRVISDILESNGSSSMASVCGATLGLMAAGVPITQSRGRHLDRPGQGGRPAATLLTDIIGDEDHFGDMDFKIAGTQNGITGIQLDLKINGISEEIIRATLAQVARGPDRDPAHDAHAPSRGREPRSRRGRRGCCGRTSTPEKIGLLIGPGGKTIRAHPGGDRRRDRSRGRRHGDHRQHRRRRRPRPPCASVEALTASVQVGQIYDGRVTSVKDFGAFIEILPGKDGLCHISELADDYVNSVADVCKVGDEMQVKVIAIDDQDRVKLSRKQALRELNKTAAGNGDGE